MFDSCGFSFRRPDSDSVRIHEASNTPHDVHPIQQSFHTGAKPGSDCGFVTAGTGPYYNNLRKVHY